MVYELPLGVLSCLCCSRNRIFLSLFLLAPPVLFFRMPWSNDGDLNHILLLGILHRVIPRISYLVYLVFGILAILVGFMALLPHIMYILPLLIYPQCIVHPLLLYSCSFYQIHLFALCFRMVGIAQVCLLQGCCPSSRVPLRTDMVVGFYLLCNGFTVACMQCIIGFFSH